MKYEPWDKLIIPANPNINDRPELRRNKRKPKERPFRI